MINEQKPHGLRSRVRGGPSGAEVSELGATFVEQGDLVWQANAATTLKDKGLDFPSVIKRLRGNMVVDCLRHI